MVVLYIKRIEVIMKKKGIILLLNSLFIHTLAGQTLIQRIEGIYNALDSTSYIENVILSYKKNELKWIRESEDAMLELRGFYNNMDSVRRQNTLDSVMEIYNTIVWSLSYREELTKQKVWEELFNASGKASAYAYLNIEDSIQRRNILDSISRDLSKISIERDYSMFISDLKKNPVHYVLNLKIDSCGESNEPCLLPDTGSLPFDLFCFDKDYKGSLYVYCYDGQYGGYDSRYRTFSRQLKNSRSIYCIVLN